MSDTPYLTPETHRAIVKALEAEVARLTAQRAADTALLREIAAQRPFKGLALYQRLAARLKEEA